MRRVAASAMVALTASAAMLGLAGPASAGQTSAVQTSADTSTSPVPPVGQIVQTALQDANTLICELFGNSVLCGAV